MHTCQSSSFYLYITSDEFYQAPLFFWTRLPPNINVSIQVHLLVCGTCKVHGTQGDQVAWFFFFFEGNYTLSKKNSPAPHIILWPAIYLLNCTSVATLLLTIFCFHKIWEAKLGIKTLSVRTISLSLSL